MDLEVLKSFVPEFPAGLNSNAAIIMLSGLVFIILLFFVLRKRKSKKQVFVTKTDNTKWTAKADILYRSIPIFSRYYKKIYMNVAQGYPASPYLIKKRTVQTVTKGFISFIAAIIFVCLLAQGDLLFLLTGFLTSFILMINMINGKLVKQETSLLLQLQAFLEVLRYYYNEGGKVDEAIEAAKEESPAEISLHIEQIYDVITAVDIDMTAEEYGAKPNNRFFSLLCTICATIAKQGDRPLPEGITVFLNSIKHLQEELNVEILKKRLIKSAFSLVSAFCLLPVFLMKPIQIAFSNNQKELAKYYNGAYGTAVMFLIFFVTLVGNLIIENLKDGKIVENDKLWQRIANLPILKVYLNKKIAKNYSKSQKIKASLKRVGSPLTVQSFYAKKIVSAIGTMLLFVVIIFSVNMREKNSLLHDFEEVFSADYAIDEQYIDTLKEFAEWEVSANIKEKGLTEEEISKNILDDLIQTNMLSKASEAQLISQAITERVTQYHDVYFKFYYIFVMYLIGVAGYMIPDIILKSRYKAMEMEMEDEIIQFQSIALILMHIKESTVEEMLTWMKKFSKCFKSSITTCIMNLDSGQFEALEELKANEPAQQFHKIINSLINVDKVGFEAAFDSLETERKFLTEKRNRDNEEMITAKSRKAWGIVFIVLFAVIGLWVIGPMALMSSGMMEQINNVF